MIYNFNGRDVLVHPCKCGCDQIYVDAGVMACQIVCRSCSRRITHAGFQEGVAFWNEQNPLPEPHPESGRKFIPCGRVLGHGESCVADHLCAHCDEMSTLIHNYELECKQHTELRRALREFIKKHLDFDGVPL